MIEAELYFSHRNIRLLKLRKHFVYYHQKVTEISYSTSICSKRSPVPLSGPFKISEHYALVQQTAGLWDDERKEVITNFSEFFVQYSIFFWHVIKLIHAPLFAEKLHFIHKSVNAEFRLSTINMFSLSIA